ncbi:peroxisome assembly protein 12 isoform X2 [Contarinia nasturtii]|uniref:peroxisome assembly protein 12 isoform X2 n=1 Tax=Contarinia nasturtii TaxID=265458 RepID=UPI0012D3C21A|nr:peroxisome assembly protein 12 isoform X2 [Contarinia nasturtii]
MAQNSVHVTHTLQTKPSIFELIAADSLQSTFYPALKRIAHHYIRCYGGSFAEVFYSLSRIHSSSGKLSSFDKVMIFFVSTIVPYISAKFSRKKKQWEEDCESDVIDVKELRYKETFIKAHNIVKGIYDCFLVLQYIRFISDRSKTHSIFDQIIGQHLVYISSNTNLDWSWSDLFSMNFRKSAFVTGIVFRTLELSAFFLQFVQWWQNEARIGNLIKLPNPDPPSYSNSLLTPRQYENICPVCLQMWKIPTVNRISGYVFCFKCIVNYLGINFHCPVTKYATSINDLVRIYDY